MKRTQRVELCLHTINSEESATLTPGEAVYLATAMKHPAVAITDLNGVQSHRNAYNVFERRRDWVSKIIYGAQVFYEKDGVYYGLNLLAKNNAGIRQLYRVISSLQDDGQRKVTTWQVVADNRENLLVGAMSWTAMEEMERYDYIAIMPTQCPQAQALQRELCNEAREKGVPVAAVGNCHYAHQEERPLKALMDRILDKPEEEHPLHFLSTEEMLQAMAYLGEETARETVVTTPNEIAKQVGNFPPCSENIRPFTLPENQLNLRDLCYEKLEKFYGKNPLPAITRRLEEELAGLRDWQQEDYFLLAYHITDRLHRRGRLTGFRGSIGSLFAAWLLGISDVNPLPAHYHCPHCRYTEFVKAPDGFDLPRKACPHCGKDMTGDGHHIPFETFMNNYYHIIDINVSEAAVEEAKSLLTELLGKDRVAMAGYTATRVEKRAELLLTSHTRRTGRAFSQEERDWLMMKLRWVKESEGKQSFGLVLLPEGMEWEDVTPLRRQVPPVDGIGQTTHMNFSSIFERLPKLNIITNDALSRLERLMRDTGVKPEDIQMETCIAHAGNTEKIPEFDTEFYNKLLRQVGDPDFHTLVKICGMAHSTNGWRENGEYFYPEHPFADLIATRDDVFLTLEKHGLDTTVAYKAMEYTRKGRFHRDEMADLAQTLRDAGVPEWYLESMERVHYLFPKAHAVHYVKLSMALVWFRTCYPEEFWEIS